MNHFDDFAAAIDENPKDTTLRLIFADWLEESGRTDKANAVRMLTAIDRDPYFRNWGYTGWVWPSSMYKFIDRPTETRFQTRAHALCAVGKNLSRVTLCKCTLNGCRRCDYYGVDCRKDAIVRPALLFVAMRLPITDHTSAELAAMAERRFPRLVARQVQSFVSQLWHSGYLDRVDPWVVRRPRYRINQKGIETIKPFIESLSAELAREETDEFRHGDFGLQGHDTGAQGAR